MYNAKLVILAYPDTFVKTTDEFLCKVLPWVGLGTSEYIKAGHAALVLIDNSSGKALYFDFGRYVTPLGSGRVRGANTDSELELPFTAKFNKKGDISNLKELLTWLASNPERTHGRGRLIASVCDVISYNKAIHFIMQLQNRGSMPYGAFVKDGTNCSRFVTDTILAATRDRKIIKALKKNKRFSPSTVGNVEKASNKAGVFLIEKGRIKAYKGSALEENLTNYFDKNLETNKPQLALNNKLPENAQELSGIGSNAWFELIDENLFENRFRIKRFNENHDIDFDGVFKANAFFDAQKPYCFNYDSNCLFCTIEQEGKLIRFDMIAPQFEAFNLREKLHLA